MPTTFVTKLLYVTGMILSGLMILASIFLLVGIIPVRVECSVLAGSDYSEHVWYDSDGEPYAYSLAEDSTLTCIEGN